MKKYRKSEPCKYIAYVLLLFAILAMIFTMLYALNNVGYNKNDQMGIGIMSKEGGSQYKDLSDEVPASDVLTTDPPTHEDAILSDVRPISSTDRDVKNDQYDVNSLFIPSSMPE